MKDYYNEAKKYDIRITPVGAITLKYSIDEENKFILVRKSRQYSFPKEEKIEYNTQEELDTNIKMLKARQESQFSMMIDDTSDAIKSNLSIRAISPVLYATCGIINLANDKPLLGCIWLAGTLCLSIPIVNSYKLKKELNLVKWTLDNKDQVNEVIKEEIGAKDNYKIPVQEEQLPYSEDIRLNGITLNNIDEIDNNELIRIKKIVKEKRK